MYRGRGFPVLGVLTEVLAESGSLFLQSHKTAVCIEGKMEGDSVRNQRERGGSEKGIQVAQMMPVSAEGQETEYAEEPSVQSKEKESLSEVPAQDPAEPSNRSPDYQHESDPVKSLGQWTESDPLEKGLSKPASPWRMSSLLALSFKARGVKFDGEDDDPKVKLRQRMLRQQSLKFAVEAAIASPLSVGIGKPDEVLSCRLPCRKCLLLPFDLCAITFLAGQSDL